MRVSLVIFSFSLLLFSCSGSKEPTQESTTESPSTSAAESTTATDTEEQDSPVDGLKADDVPVSESALEGFVVVNNQRYDFQIDIPAEWKALDISADADGFVVQIPDYEQVDVRVYGEKYDELLASVYEEGCNELIDFEFANTQIGKRCIGLGEISYWQMHEGDKLNVYIKGWDDLDFAQKTNLTTMVRSLRPENTSESTEAEVLN